MEKFKLGGSLRAAINFLQNFQHDGSPLLKKWKNFTWFHQIISGDQYEAGEDFCDASKFKILEREILFYGYKETLIAKLHMRGNKFTNSDGTHPLFWRVTKVEYVLNYNEMPPFQKFEWVTKEIGLEESPFI